MRFYRRAEYDVAEIDEGEKSSEREEKPSILRLSAEIKHLRKRDRKNTKKTK